jgi:hypothetical protein
MPFQLDRCGFLPSAGGTADFVVSSGLTGFLTPAQAGAVNARVYRYVAESGDLSQWEIGYGAYTVGTTTLARTTVVFSSNANAKVTFTAAPQVRITVLAEDIVNPANNLSDLLSWVTALANLNTENGTGIGDAAATINATAKLLYTTAAFTASRTWTLPAANAVNAGREIVVADLKLAITATNTLVMARAGTDTIVDDGAAALTSVAIDTPGAMVRAVSDGVSKWFVTRHFPFGTAAGQALRLTAAGKYPAAAGDLITGIPQFAATGSWSKTQTAVPQNLTSGTGADFSACQNWRAVVNGSTFTIANPATAPADGSIIKIRVTFTTANSVAFGNKFKTTGYTAGTSGIDNLTFEYDSTADLYYLDGVRNAVAA